MEKIDVYSASDYAGLRVGDTHFYYGYEVTTEDEEDEWCFQVKIGSREVFRKTTSQLMDSVPDFYSDEPINILLVGIGIWMAENQNIKF